MTGVTMLRATTCPKALSRRGGCSSGGAVPLDLLVILLPASFSPFTQESCKEEEASVASLGGGPLDRDDMLLARSLLTTLTMEAASCCSGGGGLLANGWAVFVPLANPALC